MVIFTLFYSLLDLRSVSVMLYPCMLCIALLMCQFVLCVACL